MGLAERRLAEQIKKDDLPKLEAQIKKAAGFDIPVVVDWNSFIAFDEYPLTRLKSYFEEIDTLVQNICVDDMGKEALRDGVKSIEIVNSDQSDNVKMELKDKTLHLGVQFAGDTYSSYGSSDMVSYLEKLI